MANFYPYLCATLPTLTFGQTPPFSCEEFTQHCAQWLAEDDFAAICALLEDRAEDARHPLCIAWATWEHSLRSALVHARSAALGLDASAFTRGPAAPDNVVRATVQEVMKMDFPWEQEQTLDFLRWETIRHLTATHIHDFAYLAMYAVHLRILHRWAGLSADEGEEIFEEAVTGIRANDNRSQDE